MSRKGRLKVPIRRVEKPLGVKGSNSVNYSYVVLMRYKFELRKEERWEDRKSSK